ncbi:MULTISPECIES: TIGR03364 family FAD-dependent oxidoreductase [Chitinophagaceae]
MKKKYDLIIVGAGILGTFHAYSALQLGLSVLLLEKDSQPMQATVRNFGEVIPSGMSRKWRQIGIRSMHIYKDLQKKTDLTVRENGTIYIGSNEDELQLLDELLLISQQDNYNVQRWTAKECLSRYPGLKASYAKGGLYFPDEITIEPRMMIGKMLGYLIEAFGLVYRNNTLAIGCDITGSGAVVRTASGEKYVAEKIIICNGSDYKILYPQLFSESNIDVVKLQLMQTVSQSRDYHIKGSILTGLSIRRYESFQECPSYNAIKTREDIDLVVKDWGIHILFKQTMDGSLIIGDSHQYAPVRKIDSLGFDSNEAIDEFMIKEAQKIFALPDYRIDRRWIGFYSQCKDRDVFKQTIDEKIHIVTAIGGKGMTAGPAFTEDTIRQLFNR